MAEVLLFHHAQGQTSGFLAFADRLSGAGHTVHAPDLYDGRTFATIEEGVGYAGEVGFGEILQRGIAAAEGLPAELVYAGFSLGAQHLFADSSLASYDAHAAALLERRVLAFLAGR
ncbi:MAG: hypothetical protein ABR575_06885 [Actinomycetota bacterium]